MNKRLILGVVIFVVACVIACGAALIHKDVIGGPCKPSDAKVYIRDGVRYLVIQLPDGQSVVVQLDALTGSPDANPYLNALRNCPCEDDLCRPMCATLPKTTVQTPVQTCPAP